MRTQIILAIALGACSSSRPSSQAAELDGIRYEAPSSWTASVAHEPTRSVARWVPEENPNKESISVIRAPLHEEAVAQDPTLASVLANAQNNLAHGKATSPHAFTTKHGLQAVVLEVDFLPPGSNEPYHRAHALVRDGKDIINVIYTARAADPGLESFRIVLDSIHHEEG